MSEREEVLEALERANDGKTDVTDLLQRALDLGVTDFPGGVYLVSRTLMVRDGNDPAH